MYRHLILTSPVTATCDERPSAAEPPWFPDQVRDVEVEVGGDASLHCRAGGDEPLSVTWSRDQRALTHSHRYKPPGKQIRYRDKLLAVYLIGY